MCESTEDCVLAMFSITAAQQQDILTLRINFAESRDTRREVMQPPRRRGGQIDRYMLASCYLDFCLYSFVLDTGLGSS